jgi:uncharacterized protein YecE (DUF72 family)
MSEIRIGTSGWDYAEWRGTFYPSDLPRRRELEYLTRQMNSLEINGTFYSLKSPRNFDHWRDTAPDDFVYAVKGSRYITHPRRLRGAETGLANYLASGILKLGEKLGPFLWQLPPNMDFDAKVFAQFCRLLPRTTFEAAELAARHDDQIQETWLEVTQDRPVRHVFEIRDPRMMNPTLVALLREFGHALAIADTGGRYPLVEDLTADFIYIRLHGPRELYASEYTEQELDRWKRRILRWAAGGQMPRGRRIADVVAAPGPRDVYVYFDNTMHADAPRNALRLAEKLGLHKRTHPVAGATAR